MYILKTNGNLHLIVENGRYLWDLRLVCETVLADLSLHCRLPLLQ